MAYFSRLQYASGFFSIDPEGKVHILPSMPEDMKERFWKDIEEERKRCEENHRKGIYSSVDLF